MNWEAKFSVQAALLGVGLVAALPFAIALSGSDLATRVETIQAMTEGHLFREITGYIGFALALIQVVFSVRKRVEWNFPGPSFPAWRGFHILAGVGFLLVVVIHSGGRLGWNLNGWLQSVFLITVFIGLAGKVWETRLLARALPAAKPRSESHFSGRVDPVANPPMPPAAAAGARASQTRSQVNRARQLWLNAHIVLTSAFMVLLGFHMFSVYYF